jgi:hypothetical protein
MQTGLLGTRLGELENIKSDLKVSRDQLQEDWKMKEKHKNEIRELKKAHQSETMTQKSRIVELE